MGTNVGTDVGTMKSLINQGIERLVPMFTYNGVYFLIGNNYFFCKINFFCKNMFLYGNYGNWTT